MWKGSLVAFCSLSYIYEQEAVDWMSKLSGVVVRPASDASIRQWPPGPTKIETSTANGPGRLGTRAHSSTTRVSAGNEDSQKDGKSGYWGVSMDSLLIPRWDRLWRPSRIDPRWGL